MDDIIRMARETGLHLPYWDEEQDPEKDPPHWAMVSPLPRLLARFAALVRADEREACAKVCETGVDYPHPTVKGVVLKNFGGSTLLATAIRARGKA